MIQGIFRQPASSVSLLNITFVLGLLCIPTAVMIHFFGSNSGKMIIVHSLLGVFLCLISSPFIFFNRKAYFYINDNYISARFSFWQKLECNVSDVLFVYRHADMLTILLKNGKRRVIGGIINSSDICFFIRKCIMPDETETVVSLKNKLNALKEKRKKEILASFFSFALIFAGIFLTVAFTGGRDLAEFSSRDWTIFSVMGCSEILTCVICFCIAGLSGKKLVVIEHIKYRLKWLLLLEHPLTSNNVISIYIDVNHSGRVIISGFPNDDSVFYTIETIDDAFNIKVAFSSKVFANLEELQAELIMENFIDVTDKVITKVNEV